LKTKLFYNINQNYISSISGVVLINILLAVIALLKDMFLAAYLGTSIEADALVLAFFITDMIGNNLIASSLGASIIPRLTKTYLRNNEKFQKQELLSISLFALILTSIFTITILFLRKPLIAFAGSGFILESKMLSIQILIILLPSMLLYPLVSIGISVMQILQKFIISSLAPVLFNLVFLMGIIYCCFYKVPLTKGVFIISLSINIAVAVMMILVYTYIFKQGKDSFIDKKVFNELIPALIETIKLFLSYLTMLFLSQVIFYVERYIASNSIQGSMAGLNYAYRLSQFPVWVFASAISTVVFPMMSRYKGEGSTEKLGQILKKSLWLMSIVTLPMMIILYVLRVPIITILFYRGAFDKNSLAITAEMLAGYSIAILGQSVSTISLKFFLSLEKMKQPLIVFFISSLFNITFDVYAAKIIGVRALGYGAALSGIVNAAIMLFMMRKNIKVSTNDVLIRFLKVFLVNLIILAITLISKYLWDLYFSFTGPTMHLIYAAFVALTCISSYVIGLKYSKLI
jgi:putative peptidoglycan lipid II flippase